MKKFLVLIAVLSIASLASAGIEIVASDLGGGSFLVEAIQDGPNPTGSGGILYFNYGGGTASQLDVVPVAAFNPGDGSFYGWNWAIVGILDEAASSRVKVSAVPNLGAGTPGVGSSMDVIKGTLYTNTASIVLTGAQAVTLTGEWDGVQLDQTIVLPEPASMVLLGLGALVLRRKK